MKLEVTLENFLEYLEIEKNKSPLTLRNYGHYLGRVMQFFKNQGVKDIERLDMQYIKKLKLFLNRYQDDNGKGLKLITQQYHIIALRSLLKYLVKQDIKVMSPDKIELAKTPSREVDVMNDAELARLFEAIRMEKDEIIRLRDEAILHLLFSSGVRISELTQLTKNHINFKTGEFTVRGKGDKLRLAFLSKETLGFIDRYLKKRHDNHPALFIAHGKINKNKTQEIEIKSMNRQKGKTSQHVAAGLTARSIQRTVKKYAMIAGIMHKVTPHTLRHSFATDMLRNGADIRSVQSLLGHASITTTQIYTHVSNEHLREVHRRLHNNKRK